LSQTLDSYVTDRSQITSRFKGRGVVEEFVTAQIQKKYLVWKIDDKKGSGVEKVIFLRDVIYERPLNTSSMTRP